MRFSIAFHICILLAAMDAKARTSEFKIRKPHEASQNSIITNGCLLPQQPIGGSFELNDCTGSSCNVLTGRIVPKGSYLTYKCNDGYTLIGNAVSYCHVNMWLPLPSCCKTCPALRSDSVDFDCRYNGKIVTCDSAIVPGTRATLACKDWYNIPFADDPGYRELICLGEGVWDRTVFHCNPECGTVSPRGSPAVVNGITARLGEFPWHVGVYKWIRNFEQICGGSLISPSIVISAAHCFYDDIVRKLESASKFAVASGKYFRLFNYPEPFAQHSALRRIDIPNEFSGVIRNYADDIAVLHLATPFTMTPFVRPICMDWDNKYEREQLRNGNSGKVMGWGINERGVSNPKLQAITLPYVDFHACFTAVPEDFKSFITTDKFCAGYLNGSSVCNGDSGGGLSFELDGRWILRGIVSAAPTAQSMCDPNYYTTFTKVGYYLRFLRNSAFRAKNFPGEEHSTISVITSVASIADRNTGIQASGCILPEQPTGGSFVLASCTRQCNIVPGNRVPIGSFLIYRCNKDYMLHGNSVTICHNNDWYMPPTCSITRKYCPALRSKSVNFDCKYHDEIVSCQHTVAPGTKATLTCEDFYQISSADNLMYREITCLENGTWNRHVFNCVPECGIAIPDGTQLIANGSTVPHGRFPWFVRIYIARRTRSEGTLISPNLVISLASFYFDETIKKVIDTSQYEAFVGEFWSFDDIGPYAQKSLVKKIDIAANYRGKQGSYNHNVALLHLETPFTMTTLVRPICIHWDNRVDTEKLENGKPDKVYGWRNESYTIKSSYISREQCVSRVGKDWEAYVSANAFCAIFCSNGSSICKGDEFGSAFGYESHGLWYLLGITKSHISPQDSPRKWVVVFLNIGYYLDWIRAAYVSTG